ncbi:hypothetical protein [Lentzea terrae]|uniref:hypothetical protein n=1 Tax=Lentzea terrae TaxID=2200761 RepID=UPI00130051C0|nr:hypothetical protein [Lentzea terrae]
MPGRAGLRELGRGGQDGPHIFLVEIPSRTAELPEGRFISFRVPEIELYPYDA